MKNWLNKYYPLLIILFIASILRINLLFVRGTFWFDEIFSFHFSQLPWGQALKYWWLETNPPFHTFFLRFWVYLTGDNELLIRLSSLIFALITIILLYYWAEKSFSRQTAIISTSLLSLSGIHLFVSTEARAYSLLVLLSLISMVFYQKLISTEKISKKTLACLTLIQTLLLYTHLTALLIPLIQLLHLFLTQSKNKIKQLIWPNLIAGAFFAIWFIPALISKLQASTFAGWFFHYNTKDTNILTIIVTLLINAELTPLIFTLTTLIIITLIILTYKNFTQTTLEKKNLIILISLWFLLPIVCGSIFGIYITKYFVYTLPAFCLLLGLAFEKIVNKKIILISGLLILSLILPSTLTIARNEIFSWPKLISIIKKNETANSAIIATPFNEELSIRRYYSGPATISGLYPFIDNLSLEERIVRFNWQTLSPRDDDYNNWMVEHTKNKDKIFFLKYSAENSETNDWLTNHGWQLVEKKPAAGHLSIYLFVYHAPNYTTTTSASTK